MDKYEFNIKVEQIKKLVNKNDYDTAMRIADTIDWRRVRNTNLLSLVSQIYEKNEDYQEAKDILLLAFERAPVGKRLLYKLSELSLKEHNVDEAEDFYTEFCDLAPEDPRQHLLRYMILKEKRAPLDQLIHSLERYVALELDEKWLYELAELYHKAGMPDDCIRICDKIMLMFGLGKYVEKAMDLKIQHAPLTSYQMDLVENRDKYEEKLRAVESVGYTVETPVAEAAASYEAYAGASADGRLYEDPPSADTAAPVQPELSGGYAAPLSVGLGDAALADLLEEENISVSIPAQEAPAQFPQPALDPEEWTARELNPTAELNPPPGMQRIYDPGFADIREHAAESVSVQTEVEPQGTYQSQDIWGLGGVSPKVVDEELIASVKVAEAEEQLAQEMSKMSYRDEAVEADEDPLGKTRILKSIREVIDPSSGLQSIPGPAQEVEAESAVSDSAVVLQPAIAEPVIQAPRDPAAESSEEHMSDLKESESLDGQENPETFETAGEAAVNNLMIEAGTPQKGLELALSALKQIHRETQSHNTVAKITSEKLNRKGLFTVVDQLSGKDLIIEKAGSLSEVLINELTYWIEAGREKRVIVLIDTPSQMENLHEHYPELARQFECIGGAEEPGETDGEQEAERPESIRASERPESPRTSKADTETAREAENRKKPETKSEKLVSPSRKTENKKENKIRTEIKPSKLIPTALDSLIHQEDSRSEEEALTEESAAMESMEAESTQPELMEPEEPMIPEEQMDIDEFAQYACKYAKEIDCSITGKSMLALYERIEIMEEEGVALTRSNAEELIEEAADRAERPSLLRLITGMFTPKYDKDDFLILREEHFIG